MKIGKLRHRITIQEYQATRDSFGAEVKEWVDIKTVWASIEPLSGREYFSAKQINAEVTTKIRTRYLKGIHPKMRVLFNDRIFEILSVINVEEKKRELELMCKEEV
ncbi:phage head closure protein [Alkaliphilus peptidifermentans]|uniref:Phage head-tail adaptor, putative, SPP1 family n=1 Tax=Alkaliphilus peptidifermentans DSM 18978 TaxID=1120976 RepID=A0A1G5EFS4_9FIRM|nr:phage head closure protein [Alkaliphilus peptidifermentans]SCY25308.1 phage head-tail adaptor, putative, SPP1 family [Alkaliphilus peptidifermentans DSM 18978]